VAIGLLATIGMFAHLKTPLGWGELIKQTLKDSIADDIPNLAAQQAYYFFFALFPALLTLISIASFFPIANAGTEIVRALGPLAPPEMLKVIESQIDKISNSGAGGILTLAFLLTIWSSSSAMVSITTTLNAAYDITESRPWWKVRLTAIGLTIGMSIFILTSIALVLVGPTVAEQLATRMHLGEAFKWGWWILQWPLVLGLVATGIAIVYYFAPDAEQSWVWITPGSIVATLAWLIVSLGLKFYVARFANVTETYGALGGVIVLLMWFWLSGLAVLLGAEFNAEIEHASPHGKAPGERVPGERKKIGVLAERDYDERRRRGEIPVTAFAEGVNCDLDGAPKEEPAVTPSELIVGTAVLIPAAIKIANEIRQKVKAAA
jgi:membrane protein